MASQDPIDAKFEVLESRLESRLKSRLEDKLRGLFAEFKIGQPPSPTKFQQGESSERPLEKEGQPYASVTYEGGLRSMGRRPDLVVSCAERYFRYYQTLDDAMVKIAIIHLEGDAIQHTIELNIIMELRHGFNSRAHY
ncbi:hypothetical protein BHM03_00016968 [Ensete ventricosum]|nr:hypothetical protein BHM03_00016968 [Ensete ventricosum]